MRNRLLSWGVALGLTLLFTVTLLQSSKRPLIGAPAPPVPTLENEIFLTVAHFTAFALLTLAWYVVARGYLAKRKSLLLVVSLVLCYGLLTEFLQSFVPDRGMSLYDITVNSIAVFSVAWLIYRQQKSP